MTKLKCFSYTVGIFRFRVFSILIGVIFRNLVDYPSSWSTYVNVRCKLNKYNKNRYVGSCVLRFYHTSSQRHNWPWTKQYTNSTQSPTYIWHSISSDFTWCVPFRLECYPQKHFLTHQNSLPQIGYVHFLRSLLPSKRCD